MKAILISFLVVIVLGLIGGIGYSLFTGVNPLEGNNKVPEIDTLIGQLTEDFTSSGEIEKIDAGQIFSLFKDVSSVSLNRSLLDDPAFLSLEDISVRLRESSNYGRQNPFLPIGIESSITNKDDVSLNQLIDELDENKEYEELILEDEMQSNG